MGPEYILEERRVQSMRVFWWTVIAVVGFYVIYQLMLRLLLWLVVSSSS